jgi:hypothetical protein
MTNGATLIDFDDDHRLIISHEGGNTILVEIGIGHSRAQPAFNGFYCVAGDVHGLCALIA